MILTITLIVFSLVALNFLLLVFSCNTVSKSEKKTIKPRVIKRVVNTEEVITTEEIITTEEVPIPLAPTGS